MGFLDEFGGRGEDIWWKSRPTSVLRTARFQTYLVEI